MNSPESSYNTSKNSINESPNSTVKLFIDMLGPERVQELSDFSEALDAVECKTLDSDTEINQTFADYTEQALANMSQEEARSIREYSGYNYKYVNSILRGFWNYDELGQRTDDKEKRFLNTASTISGAIYKSPKLPENIRTFRGTNLSSFRGYGVQSMDDLVKLEGQLFCEKGFTSSSLKKDSSFFNRDFDDGYREKCNIEIEYLVPSGSHDGIAMLSNEFSYDNKQQEYLFDKDSLFRILSVDVKSDSAHVKMALLPKELWNKK